MFNSHHKRGGSYLRKQYRGQVRERERVRRGGRSHNKVMVATLKRGVLVGCSYLLCMVFF